MAHKHERVSYHKRSRFKWVYWIALLIGVSLSTGVYWQSSVTQGGAPQATRPLVANLSASTDASPENTSRASAVSADATVVAPKKTPQGAWRIVISKSKYELSLLKGNQVVKAYDIAVGKNTGDKKKVGDMKTPEGLFKVQNIQDASFWTHDFKDGKGQIAGAYGPRFIRLKTPPWTGIGIHGTHDPSSIGTKATEGCIRLNNDDLLDLLKKIKIGTPVEIRP